MPGCRTPPCHPGLSGHSKGPLAQRRFIPSFIRSCVPFIHSSDPHASDACSVAGLLGGTVVGRAAQADRERLPSSRGVDPPDRPGTLPQSPLIEAAPFCRDPGPPRSSRWEKRLSSALSGLPSARRQCRVCRRLNGRLPSLRPSPARAAGQRPGLCVPRRETPVAAFQRRLPASACSVGLHSQVCLFLCRCRRLFCASLCARRRLLPSSPQVNDGRQRSAPGARDGGWGCGMLRVSGSGGGRVAPSGALGKASSTSWP